jgi:hypothetical protein
VIFPEKESLPSLGGKDSSRFHLNATNGKALALEHLYNLPDSGLQGGCRQRAIYDGCTGRHSRVNVASEGLEKAISVVKQCLSVEDGRVVKDDRKFVRAHGSGHGLMWGQRSTRRRMLRAWFCGFLGVE